jgi:hypothetical protein
MAVYLVFYFQEWRFPPGNSFPHIVGFACCCADGENDLPEYTRRLRSKAMDEPTTEPEAAGRHLLKQDQQLQEDFAHYTKLQQEKQSPIPEKFLTNNDMTSQVVLKAACFS